MGTVCPSLTLISFSTPAEGDGISASTLSVEISNKGSSRSTLSPGFLSHLVIVPSKMLSPICGITTSVAMDLSSTLRGAIFLESSQSTVHGQKPNRTPMLGMLRTPFLNFQLLTVDGRLLLNTSPIPSRHQKPSSRSAKNVPQAKGHKALAYPMPSRASTAHPDRQRPSRKESPQFRQRFRQSWCLREPPDIGSSF